MLEIMPQSITLCVELSCKFCNTNSANRISVLVEPALGLGGTSHLADDNVRKCTQGLPYDASWNPIMHNSYSLLCQKHIVVSLLLVH